MLDYPIEGGKGGTPKAHTPVETPNNLISVAYAKVLIAVAEGELAGQPTDQDIFLDGTPLANADGSRNFGGVKWEWRSGTTDQTYIQGLPEVSTEYGAGVELKFGTPWVRQITQNQLDAVRVTFNWPALLEQKSNGDTVGYSIDYMIEVSTDGGPFIEYQRYNVNGKTNAGYSRTHRVDLNPSSTGWTIRATKLTQDNTSGNVQDNMNVASFAEVVDAKQRYPNTALLYVEFDSRMFGGGAIPRVSVRTRGRLVRVPNNYNPETRAYIGVWNGAWKFAWTDNPAWIYHDILTQDRFGLGNKVTLNMVDKYGLYEIAQYCDVMVDDGTGSGRMEPRHTCNIYIQQKSDAWQVLRDLASIFNGMTYWNGNQFTAVADKQESFNNAALFSRSNVVNGRFDYAAADDKSIYTSALVSYDEPTNHYNTEVEAVFETSQIIRWGGDRQTELNAIGCTSRGEAQRKGKYTLITNLYNRTVSFRTGLQGLNGEVMPGKLIHVVDPLIGGRPFTGRVKAAVGRVITLDRDVEAVSGDILYMTRGNGITEGRTIESAIGAVITLRLPFTETPAPNAVWYLEAADLKSQLFRVLKVTSPESSVYEIEAVEYNDSKYAAIDNGARLEPRPISVTPPGIQAAPREVNVSAYTYIEQTMAVSIMDIVWPTVENAVGYEVQWRVDNNDWVNVGTTGTTQVSIRGIYSGQYVARVRAINPVGIRSVWTSSMITNLEGKVGKPPRVTSLIASELIFGIRLDWTFPPNAEDTLRTEFRYSENESFDSSIPLGDFAYPINAHELHGISAGKRFWFWCRLHDRTGNIGEWYPYDNEFGVLGQSAINDDGQYNEYFAGLIGATALDKQLYDRVELIDGNGPGSVNERLENAVKDLEDQIQQYQDALVYDPTKTYNIGEYVRQGQRLYQAIANVPLDTTPPNTDYWYDIGQILETTNNLALQVEENRVDIEDLDGLITSTVTSLETIQALYRDDDGVGEQEDAIAGWNSRAQITEERTVRANADEAFAQELVSYLAELNGVRASVTDLTQVVATNDEAVTTRLTELQATIDEDVTAAIRQESEARATADEALSRQITTLEATVNEDITAQIRTEAETRANADGALGQRIDTVSATVGNNSAAIQQQSTVIAGINGKVSAAYTVKLEVNQNGQYVAAGIGLGIENGPAGLQSQFLVRADRFAVVSGNGGTTAAPFVVQGGQVFISQALIGTGWITNAMIGNFIQSNNYQYGTSGWRIDKSGDFELNGSGAGYRTLIRPTGVYITNTNTGVLVVELGLLT